MIPDAFKCVWRIPKEPDLAVRVQRVWHAVDKVLVVLTIYPKKSTHSFVGGCAITHHVHNFCPYIFQCYDGSSNNFGQLLSWHGINGRENCKGLDPRRKIRPEHQYKSMIRQWRSVRIVRGLGGVAAWSFSIILAFLDSDVIAEAFKLQRLRAEGNIGGN